MAYNFDKEKFLKVVINYAKILGLALENKTIKEKATQWALLRGSYSGREALKKNLSNLQWSFLEQIDEPTKLGEILQFLSKKSFGFLSKPGEPL